MDAIAFRGSEEAHELAERIADSVYTDDPDTFFMVLSELVGWAQEHCVCPHESLPPPRPHSGQCMVCEYKAMTRCLSCHAAFCDAHLPYDRAAVQPNKVWARTPDNTALLFGCPLCERKREYDDSVSSGNRAAAFTSRAFRD